MVARLARVGVSFRDYLIAAGVLEVILSRPNPEAPAVRKYFLWVGSGFSAFCGWGRSSAPCATLPCSCELFSMRGNIGGWGLGMWWLT